MRTFAPPVLRSVVPAACLALAGCAGAASTSARAPDAMPAASRADGPDVRLPWSVVRLENGLTLLMHPDSSMPDVGVEVWMRGGSREEAPGEFGIAHLFEHNVPTSGRFLGNAENRTRFGQSGRGGNAGTEQDFLRFWNQSTPEGLEFALGYLADRLESDSARFTEETLRRDQDVVASELRRSLGGEYDPEILSALSRGTFGPEHPYGHAPSGSEADVRAATVELMRDWHRRFAGASSSIVLVAGRFDPARAEAMVRHHFGSIRPGTPAPRPAEWVPAPRPLREVLEMDLPRGRVYLRWPAPGWGSADADHLSLLARILAQRVRPRAAQGAALDSTFARMDTWEVASAFTLGGTFGRAASPDSAEAALRGELERLLRDGPSADELARARAQLQAEFVRTLQQPAWRGGRTDVLGMGLMYRGDPDHYRTQLARIAAATPAEVRDAGRRWLAPAGYVLHVLARPARTTAAPVDRTATVQAPPAQPAEFPAVGDATLPNGLRLLVVERPTLPLVQLALAFHAGAGTDEPATAGRARVALEAVPRIPVDAGGTPLADALSALGAELGTRMDGDLAVLHFSVLSDRTDDALRLVASALARPVPDAVVAESREGVLQALEGADPRDLRERPLACLLAAPAPCNPGALDGLGTRAGLRALVADDVRAFLAAHYHPANAALIAVGDVRQDALAPLLASAMQGWTPRERPRRAAPAASAGGAGQGGVAIVDFPGASQSYILAVQPLPAAVAADPLMAQLLAWVLRSRLMANLREDKGWTYEIYPFGVDVRADGNVMRFHIPVHPERTGEAIGEIRAEWRRLIGTAPSSVAGSKGALVTYNIAGALTSVEQMGAQLVEVARGGIPAGWYADALRRLPAITPAEVHQAAQALLDPDALLWIIAGDRALLERELAEAGITGARVYTPAELR